MMSSLVLNARIPSVYLAPMIPQPERYGFNCGSTLQISTSGYQNAAGRAALNTTIGAGESMLYAQLARIGAAR